MNPNPVARIDNVVIQETSDETLIYDLESNRAFCLNETVTAVYRLCDGRHTIGNISDKLSLKFGELVSEELVRIALEELRQNGLLEQGGSGDRSYFGGVSRREMIRRAGLASMAALPLITALSAPKAIHAQSGCASTSCSTVANCGLGCTSCVGATGTCGTTGFPCSNIGSTCTAQGICINGACSIIGGTGCPPPGGTCSATGTCTAGICSVPGGTGCPPTGPGTCTSFGICINGICSVPGGTGCPPAGGTCVASGTCVVATPGVCA